MSSPRGSSLSGPSRRSSRRWRRTTAVVALAAAAWIVLLGVTVAVDDFPRGLLLLLCAALVAAGAWEGVLRRGWGRVADRRYDPLTWLGSKIGRRPRS